MTIIRKISGAFFVIGLFLTWGLIGAADCGEYHPKRIIAFAVTTAIAGLIYVLSEGKK